MYKIGLYMDVSNLYYCIKKYYDGRKLDYSAYLDFVKEMGDLEITRAFMAQRGNEAYQFIHYLEALGYKVISKSPKAFHSPNGTKHKADWDVGLTIEVIKDAENLDMVILGTADGDFLPLVEYLKDKGTMVVVMACTISKELKDSANACIEIPESLLEKV